VGTSGADGTLKSSNGTTDEFGTPRDTATIGQRRYGWLGAKQRAADTPGGLTLMGVRLYNPTTGRFLSVDPIAGGNANAYEYCSGDPVNCFDLDGRWGWGKRAWRFVKRHRGTFATVGATVGCGIPGVGWASCGALQAAAWGVRSQQRASRGGGWRRTWRKSAGDGIFTAATFGTGSAIRSLQYSGYARSTFRVRGAWTKAKWGYKPNYAPRWGSMKWYGRGAAAAGTFTGWGGVGCRVRPRRCR
jgi:RHS repeat-associated protein